MENKSNQSGGQSNRNRNNNRNRNRNQNRNGGQQRNSNNNNNRSNSNRNGNKSNNNRNRNNNNNRNRNRNRKPKLVELTTGQKILKAITFGAIDPNKNINQGSKSNNNNNRPQPKTKKPAQPMSEKSTSSNPKPRQRKKGPKLHEVTSPRLYVGNLDYGAAEDDLEELFRGVGNVISAEVVTNSRTQQSKGFAFIEMGSMEEAKRAVEVLHDQDFMGRKLLVSGARSEGPRTSEETEAAEVA